MNNNLYLEKYIKYKTKYLNLIKEQNIQYGGIIVNRRIRSVSRVRRSRSVSRIRRSRSVSRIRRSRSVSRIRRSRSVRPVRPIRPVRPVRPVRPARPIRPVKPIKHAMPVMKFASHFTITDYGGGGNCLFLSIASFHKLIPAIEPDAFKLRQDIVRYIRNNRADFEPSMMVTGINTFNNYIAKMARAGEWGDDIEITAACKLYNINIFVYDVDRMSWTVKRARNPLQQHTSIYLYYINGCHYQALTIDSNKIVDFNNLIGTNMINLPLKDVP
jgi:hypothetical protein